MRRAESGSTARPRLALRIAKAGAATVVLASVAVAFADSSIVVLALPDLLEQFDVSIGSVAWVVTAYNIALAIAALALVRVAPRLDAARLARVGGVIFLVASLACAVAPGVWSLVAFRASQGLGAALLLLGALPLARALARTPARGSALWTGAGVFGAALGPAVGGMLTDVFSWRAIFLAQAPIAALAVAVVLRLPAPARDEPREDAVVASGRSRWAAGVALALASAALVGLLFLAVVQLIDIWRLSPLRAGAVVTVIPLATLVAAPFGASAGAGALGAGGVLLAGGLAGMAFLPAHNLAWVVAALAISGLGYGLLVPSLTRSALSDQGSPAASGALTLWMRHAGLVAGLLVLTPLLASDLTAAGERAKLRGISVVLDAPVPATTKLRLAVGLAPVLSVPARKGLPNFTEALASERAPPVTRLGHDLDSIVQATVTRGFRRSFVLAALFALLAAASIALASRIRADLRRALRAPAAALLIATALVAAELAGGALAYGARPRLLPPCAHRQALETHGADAEAQRIVLAGLDQIACRLHESREQLVADLARRGVDGAQFATRIERYAKLVHLPGWLGD
jgi:predicted MFS family arabinose efflux permease